MQNFSFSTQISCQIPITQGIHCSQDDISHHIPWKNHKNGFIHRRKNSWTLLLSRNDWIPNYLDHFRSAISSFFSFTKFRKILFANIVEGLDTRMMYGSSMVLTSSHQFWEEIWTNSTYFMVINQLIHQESEIANVQPFTSTPRPLLPKQVLWFRLSWGYLIIIPLIMVMMRFTLQSFASSTSSISAFVTTISPPPLRLSLDVNLLNLTSPLTPHYYHMHIHKISLTHGPSSPP